MIEMNKRKIYRYYGKNREHILYFGDSLKLLKKIPPNSIDLTITSPPYCMGKEYESRRKRIEDFTETHKKVLPEIVRVTKDGGSICWQVGYHVKDSIVTPLDFLVYEIMQSYTEVLLRNRIIWAYGHGLHCQKRFSGRHEMLLWYTKGNKYYFDLDEVRVPQKYPGKKHFKGSKKGQYSGNPLGKNPSNLWEIPNVKASHIEKTEHPSQFPIALAQRLIRGLCPRDGVVLDPFSGVGTTCVASIIEKRKFVGAEINKRYHRIAIDRCRDAFLGKLRYRSMDEPIRHPNPNEKVTQKPPGFV